MQNHNEDERKDDKAPGRPESEESGRSRNNSNISQEEAAGLEAEKTGDGDDNEGKKVSYRMVDVNRGPGSKEYQFATHAPPPEEKGNEDEKVPNEDRTGGLRDILMDGEKVSAPFIIAILIIIAVLFTGIMFASHRRELRDLGERLEIIEEHLDIPENAG